MIYLQKKPVPKPRQNVQKQTKLPMEPVPTGPLPLPPPTAKENTEMAKKAIQNIITENPKADITEVVIQTTNFVAKYCDENGGYLEVGSKIVTLLVPPFALEETTLIYVHIEESHYFTEGQKGQQIAPVVHCGTAGTKFNSPVILTFLTSVNNTEYLNVTGLRKSDVENQQEDWKETSKDDGKVVSIGNGKCVLMLNHFTGDTVAATPREERHFAQICFTAFTSPVMREDLIFDIRVWMSSKKDVLEQVSLPIA